MQMPHPPDAAPGGVAPGKARGGGGGGGGGRGETELRGSLATLASVETVLASNKTGEKGGAGRRGVAGAAADAVAVRDAVVAAAAAKPQPSPRQQFQQQQQKAQQRRGGSALNGMASQSTLSTAASSTRSMLSHVSLRQMASSDEEERDREGGRTTLPSPSSLQGSSGWSFGLSRGALGVSFATLGSIPDDYTGGCSSTSASVSASEARSGAIESITTSARSVCGGCEDGDGDGDGNDDDDGTAYSDLTPASGSIDGGANAGDVHVDGAAYPRPAARGRRRSSLFSIPDDIELELEGLDLDDDEHENDGAFRRPDGPARRRRSSLLTIDDDELEAEFDDSDDEEAEEDAKPPAADLLQKPPHSSRNESILGVDAEPTIPQSCERREKVVENENDGKEHVEATKEAAAISHTGSDIVPQISSGTDLSSMGGSSSDLSRSSSGGALNTAVLKKRRMRRSNSATGGTITGTTIRRDAADGAGRPVRLFSRQHSLESVRAESSSGVGGLTNEDWAVMPILDPEDGPPLAMTSIAAATLDSSAPASRRTAHRLPGLESDGHSYDQDDGSSIGTRSALSTSSSHRRRQGRRPSDGSALDRLLNGTNEGPAIDDWRGGGVAPTAGGGGTNTGIGNSYDWNRPNTYLNQAPAASLAPSASHRAVSSVISGRLTNFDFDFDSAAPRGTGGLLDEPIHVGEQNSAPVLRGPSGPSLGLDLPSSSIAQNSAPTLRGPSPLGLDVPVPVGQNSAPRVPAAAVGLSQRYRPPPSQLSSTSFGAAGTASSSSLLLDSLRELDLRSLPQEGVGQQQQQASASSIPTSIRSAPVYPSYNGRGMASSSSISFLDSLQSLDLRGVTRRQQDGEGDGDGEDSDPYAGTERSLPSSASATAQSSRSILDRIQSVSVHQISSAASHQSSAGSILERLQGTTAPQSAHSSAGSVLDRLQSADFRRMSQDGETLGPSPSPSPSPSLPSDGPSSVPLGRFGRGPSRASPEPQPIPQVARDRVSSTPSSAPHQASSSAVLDHLQNTDFPDAPQQGRGSCARPQVSGATGPHATGPSSSSSSILDRIQNFDSRMATPDTAPSRPNANRRRASRSSFTVPPSHAAGGLLPRESGGRRHQARSRRSFTAPPSRTSGSDGRPSSESSSSILDRLQNTDFRQLVRDREREEESLRGGGDEASIDPRGPRAEGSSEDYSGDDEDDSVATERTDRSLAAEYARLSSRRARNSITIAASRRRPREPARRTSSITLPVRNGNEPGESIFDRIQRLVDEEGDDSDDDDEEAGLPAPRAAAAPSGRMDGSSPPNPGRLLPATESERRAHVVAQQMRRASPTPLMRGLGLAPPVCPDPGQSILDGLCDNPLDQSSFSSLERTQNSVNSRNVGFQNPAGGTGGIMGQQESWASSVSSSDAAAARPGGAAPPRSSSAPAGADLGISSAASSARPKPPPKPPALSAPSSASACLSPLYLAVSSCAPHETVRSLIDADPSAAGRPNRGGLTPLHCGVDRYDTPLCVIRTLLVAEPFAAGARSLEGRTPLDLLWKRLFDPEPYRSETVRMDAERLRGMMEAVVAGDGCDDGLATPSDDEAAELTDSLSPSPSSTDGDSSGSDSEDRKPCHRQRTRKANAIRALYSSTELRQSWDIVTTFVRAARYGTVDDDTSASLEGGSRFRLVHSVAALGCPALLLRFSAALNPDQICAAETSPGPGPGQGRLPLHLAAAAHLGGEDGGADGADIEGTISTLVRLHPLATFTLDSEGRLPLNLAIESRKPWGAIRALLLACPLALRTRDVKTRMLPFMISAVGDGADVDVIYRLLRENPLEVSRGIC